MSGGQPVGAPQDAESRAIRLISIHEGRYAYAYRDSKQIPTVGVGHNLQKEGSPQALQAVGADHARVVAGEMELTDDQIDGLLRNDIERAKADVRAHISGFDALSEARRVALQDMCFNLGATKFAGFEKFRAAVSAGQWQTAGAEMKNSAWWGQVGVRAVRLRAMIEHGVYPSNVEALLSQPPATATFAHPGTQPVIDHPTPPAAPAPPLAPQSPPPTQIPTPAAPQGGSGGQAIPLASSVTIAVIDCRSGRPVAGAPVASLTVDGRQRVGKQGLATDAEGKLRVLLSVNALPNGIKVRIAFRDFAIVREASRAERGSPATVVRPTIRSGDRDVADPGPTGFHVFWKGPQRAPSWGWRVANVDHSSQPGEAAAEFRTELELRLPPDPAKTGAWERLGDGSGHAVSAHCREPSEPAVVLFALQYTPPLWLDLDALPRPARWAISGGYGTDGVVESIEHEVPRPGMFLVTRPTGSGRCGGRDYGIYIPHPTQQTKTRTIGGPHAHYGIDLAAREGITPVFAVFGARVDRAYSSEHGMGHSVWLKAPRANHQIRYAHLAEAPTGLGRRVMAGQHIGFAGRSFNVINGVVNPYTEPTHLHVEAHRLVNNVQHHVEPRECIDPASPHAAENLSVLPMNSGRRLFPCDCEGGTERASGCAGRGGDDTALASDCWAARNGLCPYDPMSHP